MCFPLGLQSIREEHTNDDEQCSFSIDHTPDDVSNAGSLKSLASRLVSQCRTSSHGAKSGSGPNYPDTYIVPLPAASYNCPPTLDEMLFNVRKIRDQVNPAVATAQSTHNLVTPSSSSKKRRSNNYQQYCSNDSVISGLSSNYNDLLFEDGSYISNEF